MSIKGKEGGKAGKGGKDPGRYQRIAGGLRKRGLGESARSRKGEKKPKELRILFNGNGEGREALV